MRLKFALVLLILIGIRGVDMAARKYCKKTVPVLVKETKNGVSTEKYVKKVVKFCCKGYRKSGGKCVPECDQLCENGKCTMPNVCTCDRGYKKFNDFRCVPNCENCKFGYCSAPNVCNCFKGYEKSTVNGSCIPSCTNPCINGYCSHPDFCACNDGYKISNTNLYTCVLNQTITTTEEMSSSTDAPSTEIFEILPDRMINLPVKKKTYADVVIAESPSSTERYRSTEWSSLYEILSSTMITDKILSSTEISNSIESSSNKILNSTEMPTSMGSISHKIPSSTEVPSSTKILSSAEMPTSNRPNISGSTEIPSSTETPERSSSYIIPSSTKITRSSFAEIPSSTKLPRFAETTEISNKQINLANDISSLDASIPELSSTTEPSDSTEVFTRLNTIDPESGFTSSELETNRTQIINKFEIISSNAEPNAIESCDHDCQFGKCVRGICRCNNGYKFHPDSKKCISSCSCENGVCNTFDLCECFEGYEKRNQTYCSPVCDLGCINADCIAPNFCKCWNGFIENGIYACKPKCDESRCANGTCDSADVCRCNEGFMRGENEFVCIENFLENKKEYVIKEPGNKMTSMAGMLSLFMICAAFLILCGILLHFIVLRKLAEKAYNIDKLERNKGTVKYTTENDVITA